MNNPKNLTAHPEIGPRGPVGGVVGGEVRTGTIIFNPSQPPSSTENPVTTIQEAIASGDTTRRRVQQFEEAMRPQHK